MVLETEALGAEETMTAMTMMTAARDHDGKVRIMDGVEVGTIGIQTPEEHPAPHGKPLVEIGAMEPEATVAILRCCLKLTPRNLWLARGKRCG